MALDGLASSPELNGQAVVVMAFLVERGRYQCELLDGGRKLAVLAKRLRKLTESEAAGVATQMEERAAAEQAELAGLAAALEQEELQKANTEANATTAEEEEDGGTVITGGDVDWAAVDNPGGGSGAAAGVSTSAEVQMEAGERFVYEIRYTLNAPAEVEGAEARTLGTAGTVIREDAAGAGAVLVAGFVHLAGSAEAMAVLLCTTCATTAGAAGSAAAAGGELVAVAIATADGPDYPEQGQLTPTRDATDEELGATRASLSVGRLDDLAIEALVADATYAFGKFKEGGDLGGGYVDWETWVDKLAATAAKAAPEAEAEPDPEMVGAVDESVEVDKSVEVTE
jgi:hypothetical protein